MFPNAVKNSFRNIAKVPKVTHSDILYSLRVKHKCMFNDRNNTRALSFKSNQDDESSQSNNNNNPRNRPVVHLSSAIGVKYHGKEIGSSYPITPHEVSPPRSISLSNISIPDYARNGTSEKYNDDSITIHDSTSIQKIRTAGELARNTLDMAISMARQGANKISTDSIDEAIHNAILNANAYPSLLRYNGFPKSSSSSINEVLYRGVPDSRLLQNGDVLTLELGIYLGGVHASTSKTILVGNNDLSDDENERKRWTRAQRLISASQEALETALQVCVNGGCISKIGKYIQQVADDYDYQIVPKICGSGIGSFLHMPPAVKVRT